jgi:hypothetical protein
MEDEAASLQGGSAAQAALRLLAQPRVVLAAGLAALAIAMAVVLSTAPPAVTRSAAHLPSTVVFGRSRTQSRICQAGEVLPRGTTAIRVWLEAVIGPHVEAQALSAGRVIARGARGAGWTSGSVTIPIAPVPSAPARVSVCVNVAKAREPVGVQGVHTATRIAATDRQGPATARVSARRAGPLPGRIVIEYLQPGHASWWSLVRSVARRMGLGHAGSGPAIALLAFALMLAAAGLTVRQLLRELA